MSPSGSKGKGKDKGKAPARSSNSGWDSRQQNTAALQRALRHKYGKKKSRAEQARRMSNDEGPFAGLEPIDQSTDDEEITDDELTTDQGANYDLAEDREEPSKDTWEEMRRDYEAMSEQMAHFRAMIQRREQLDTSATPGGSGSRHRVPDSVAYAAPVARGQAAFDNPPPQPPRPQPQPQPRQSPPLQPAPPPLQEGRHRHLVPMPESKANTSVEMILQDAGLSAVRWREINNIIRDLMARVGMDYTTSWTRQNKQAMGALYAWILEEVPELAIFRNGWASEWIVQRKFDNRLYNMRKKKREPEAAVNGAPDEQHDLPAGLASVAPHTSEPSAHWQGSTNNTPPPEADTELQRSSSHPRPHPSPRAPPTSSNHLPATQPSSPSSRPSELHQHSTPPPRDLVQPQFSPLPTNQQPPSRPSLPPLPTLPQHPDPHSSPALIANRNSRSRRGRDPHLPPFSNLRRSTRISGNHVDGANTAAGTNIRAATTPSGGNNKRRGNQNARRKKKKRVRKGDLPMPSLEDTDDGAQPTTDEE